MDPQKLPEANPDANRPTPTNPPAPPSAANDVSMSEESSVPPGTVVVGGQPAPPTEPANTATTPPSPNGEDPKIAAFMRGDAPSDMPAAPAKKKTGLIAVLIAAVLLLVGGSAAAYIAFLRPNPDKVLQAALVNSFSKEAFTSVGFEGDVSITDAGNDMTYSLDFSGAAGQDGRLTLSASLVVPSLAPITLDVQSADGQGYYLKVGGLAGVLPLLELIDTTAPYAPILAAMDDQWYEVNQAVVEQFAGSAAPTFAGLSDDDRQKLADAYQQNSFLTVVDTLDSEQVAGVDSYHYRVAVDGEKFKAFLSAVEAANIESLGLTGTMLDTLKSSVDDAALANDSIDVWIAKDSKLFTRFSYNYQDGDGRFDVTLTLKDYNKDITVEEPVDAQPITNVLTPLYQLFLGAGLGSDVPDNLLLQ